ncbi:MAG: HNH endonuclease [Deltaproteobacteria bacterium]|nr:HNH endonuclease [Deltaproteobacteria bacterium]
MQKLRRVQDLESQRLQRAATFEDTLSAALDAYLEKYDPLKKAQRSVAKLTKLESKSEFKSESKPESEPESQPTSTSKSMSMPSPQSTNLESEFTSEIIFNALRSVSPRIKAPHGGQRKPNSAVLKHQLNLRDQARCTHKGSQGHRCENTRWLDFHHLVPVHLGGDDILENLTTLCSVHHQMQHLKT